MSSAKQEKKQTKREKKAQKEAARQAARRAEIKRNRITAAIVAVVALVGLGIAAVTVIEDRRETAAAEEEQAAELEAIEAELEAIDNREVACGADEPDNAGEDRPTFEDGPDQVLEDGVDYRAVIDTSCGEVVLDLRQDLAPETVNSFVFLAEEGFYDGLEVFRINESIEILQTGSGSDDASWNIGYTISDELELAQEEGYPAGSVAMANSGPDSAGSQFFFIYGDGFEEVHGQTASYARFADVVDGLDVLQEIGERGNAGDLVAQEIPADLVYMNSVRIETD